MRLIIVRHGETEGNVAGIIQGHSDTPLSAKGRAQVVRLAERLQHEPIDIVYSSDLLRAQETAQVICTFHALTPILVQDLRERSYGDLDGKPAILYREDFARSGLPRERYRPPGGESLPDLAARASRFLQRICEQHPEQTISLVAHAGINRIMLKLLLNKTFAEASTIEQSNTCVNIFNVPQLSKAQAVLINCSAHLEVGVESQR